MTSSEKRGFLPKLRFPEFREVGEWEVRNLGRVADNLDNRRVPITSGERVAGIIPYYGASGVVDYVKGFIFDEDLLCVSEDGANLVARTYPIAFPISGKTWVNNHAHVLRFQNLFTQKFVEVYLNSIKLDDFITGMAQPKLNKAMLDSIPIPWPTIPEQQRIADCLTSLDELITLEAQQLDTLKTHKNGLMQQLFPAEGETLPKLRFPEFRDAGEWKTKSLIDLAIGGLSNGVFNDPGKVGHGYKLINVLDMYIETPIDDSRLSLVGIGENEFLKNKVEPNDIFFTRSSLVKAGIAQSNIYLGSSDDVTFDGHLIRLRPDVDVTAPMFLHYALKSGYVRSQLIAKGKTATMTTIGQADIASTKLAIPHSIAEQQKIADCLTSLDDLITAQTQQLAALKTHKNGLMQQLFPALDEVPA